MSQNPTFGKWANMTNMTNMAIISHLALGDLALGRGIGEVFP